MAHERNALISVYDKTDLDKIARGLAELDWQLLASGGTAEVIRAAGIEVEDVSVVSKGKEILGGRVKTLSRGVHAGFLAKPIQEDLADLEAEDARWIELACVNPYDLTSAINDPDKTEEEIWEMIDVGGPAMIGAAIKGERIVVTNPRQYEEVLAWLREGRPDDAAFRRQLYTEAAQVLLEDATAKLQFLGGTAVFSFIGEKSIDLKYGTNPQQKNAAVYTELGSANPLSLKRFEKLQGTELSATNIADIGHTLVVSNRIAAGFERNFGESPFTGVAGKHTNPCGAAIGKTPEEVIRKTLEGDLLSVFGGATMFNFPLDKDLATLLVRHARAQTDSNRALDVVVAPEVSTAALEVLQRKGDKLRVVVNPALASLSEATMNKSRNLVSFGDSVVAEDPPTFVWDFKAPEMLIFGKPTEEQLRDATVAWGVGSDTFSNTITIVKDGMVLANAAGQQSRVDAAKVAVARAKDRGHDLTEAVVYTDSFFPYPDAVEVLIKAGIGVIIGTTGSTTKYGLEAIETIKRNGVVLLAMPDSLARGFRH